MRRVAIAIGIFFAAALPSPAHGFGAGVFGYSGKPPAESCNQCHSGGTAPTVTLSGPPSLAFGQTATYSIDIVTGASSHKVGFDIATDQGALAVVNQTNESWLNSGEITHTKNWAQGKEVRVMFNLTAPSTTGILTLYGTALNSDGVDDPSGDAAAAATLQVEVSATGAPFDLSTLDAISNATEKPTPQDMGPPKDEARWACSFGEGAAASGLAFVAAALMALALRRRRAD